MAYEPCLVERNLILIERSVMVCVVVIGKLQKLPVAVFVGGNKMAERVRVMPCCGWSGGRGSACGSRPLSRSGISRHNRHGRYKGEERSKNNGFCSHVLSQTG